MATNSNDLVLYYSGASTISEAQNLSIKSLGNYRSIVKIPNGRYDNIFDEVGIYETNVGQDIFRCIFIRNENANESMFNLSLWIEGKKDFERIFFGVSLPIIEIIDNIPIEKVQRLDSQNSMPYNVDFVEAYSEPEKYILINELRPNEAIALWLRRLIEPTQIRNNESNLIYHFSWT